MLVLILYLLSYLFISTLYSSTALIELRSLHLIWFSCYLPTFLKCHAIIGSICICIDMTIYHSPNTAHNLTYNLLKGIEYFINNLHSYILVSPLLEFCILFHYISFVLCYMTSHCIVSHCVTLLFTLWWSRLSLYP